MTDKIAVPARLQRAGDFEPRAPDAAAVDPADERRVSLTFSSEAPYLRDFGLEVLGHGDGEVDMARMASGRAPLLVDHVQSVDSQVGVVEKAWIESGRGRAVVRFGQSARAQEILARVRDGEVTGVSVGYEITRLVKVGEAANGEPIIRASWRPYEITLCPVPADETVGVGRSAEGGTRNLPLEIEKEETAMSDTTTTTTAPAEEKRAATPAQPNAADLMKAERTRAREIRALGRKFRMADEIVDKAVDGETTVDQFQRQILDEMGSDEKETTRSRSAAVGLSDKEVKSFSLLRAVQYLANPNDKRAREAAAFEIEVSTAAETKLGRSARGLLVPADILAHQAFVRAGVEVGGTASAAKLVATEHLDGSFIGMLRKRAALTRLGVRTLTGLHGNIDIPRQATGSTAYWVGEGVGPTDSAVTFNALSLTPHTLAGAVPITRKAMQQSSPDVEALVRDDLIAKLSLEIDRVGINGDADTDAPDGLLDSAINSVAFAAPGLPTWAEIVEMEAEIASDDADVDGMKYLFNAAMRGHLKATPKVAGTAEFIMQGTQVNGYESVTSNNSPAASAILGNWTDLVLAMWSGLDLTVDQSTLAASGGVVLRAFQDVDFGVRHAESFCRGA